MAIIRKPTTKQEKPEDTTKKTSAQILKEIAKAKGIISSIGDGINIIDRTFRVIYQNQVHKDMMGVHVGEFCYKAYVKRQDICGGCPVALTFKDGEVHLVQRELKTDKGTRYAEITTFPLKDSKGKIIAGIEVVRDITEHKKAEKLIDDALTFNKTIFEASPIGIITYKASGQCVSVNESIAKMVEGTVDQLLKQNFYHLESWKKSGMLKLAKEALATGIEKRKDVHVVSTFGKEVWFACLFVPFQFANEPHLLALFTDITERKRTEEALQAGEEKYRILFNSVNDAIFVHEIMPDGLPGKFLEANEIACKRYGYSREELIRMRPTDLDAPEGLRAIPEAIKMLRANGYAVWEGVHLTKDGRRIIEEISNSVFNFLGRPLVIASAHDITDRKKAEEALRASEAELHDNYFIQAAINMILSESLENIPLEEFLQKALNMILSIPWIAFEAIGSISLVEDKADALMMKAQSNIPKPLQELCLRVPFGKCLCGKAAQAQKIQFADHIDERHATCYEGMVPHGHYSVPILSGGRTLGVLNIYLKEGHIRNQKEEEFLNTVANTLAGIIMRRKAEKEKQKLHDQLLQAQKMEAVGQLSGGIAHDFNNILTAIIGYGNLLKLHVEKDSTLSTYMKYILDSAERAAKLTQDLLAFSRKQVISPKPINVNEVIKGAEKILHRLIGEDIEFSIHLSDKDLTVMADNTQMEHVLMNLATNARDAMPEGGNLFISSDFTEIDYRFINMYGYGETGRYAVIIVSDTGVGIDEQTKDKIFEPFFTTKEVGKGTGLGLAMVYGMVKQHDGFINVYSEIGKGTTFKIYLPLIHAEITDTKEIELPISKGGIETILIAEDDALVRKFMREVLEDAGYTVIEAKDGKDAIKAFNENKGRIKLLILDVIMPKKNGKEVYETLKESNPYIKALFTSGYSADIIHKKGIISEGPEVILKPVSSDKLLTKIRDLLDQ